MKKDAWQFRDSGLALITLPIYPDAYQVFPDLNGLVEYLKLSQGYTPPVQSDISTNPYILTSPDSVHGARTLRIISRNNIESTWIYGFLSDMRSHTKDLGGDPASVCLPYTYFNRSHYTLSFEGFTLKDYHTWAMKNCPGYRPPPKAVVKNIEPPRKRISRMPQD